MEHTFAQMSERDLFVATGAQSYFFNTLFQVLADLDARPPVTPIAKDLLFISDILNYWLCGVVGCERTLWLS
jgi:rhamnulokinase